MAAKTRILDIAEVVFHGQYDWLSGAKPMTARPFRTTWGPMAYIGLCCLGLGIMTLEWLGPTAGLPAAFLAGALLWYGTGALLMALTVLAVAVVRRLRN